MPASGMGSRGGGGQGSSSQVSRGGGNRYSKSKKKSRSKKRLVSTEELIETEKKVLLAEKQGELDDVWNKHDMLVCIPFPPVFFAFIISGLFQRV
jgi:hypothetical protein